MQSVRRTRESIVDGIFYPSDPEELTQLVQQSLESSTADRHDAVMAVSPHAAYDLCGTSIATAIDSASDRRIETVLVIAPVHREPADAVFVTESNEFLTPIGPIEVDIEASDELESCGTRILRNDIPHLEEHAIEVQLPFIKTVFPEARLVPVLLGRSTRQIMHVAARAIEHVFADSLESLFIVLSSNLCARRTPQEASEQVDRLTRLIRTANPEEIIGESTQGILDACGACCIATGLSLGLPELATTFHPVQHSRPDRTKEAPRETYYGAITFHPATGVA